MNRTISLLEIVNDGSLCVKFADKQFGPPSLDELLQFSNDELEEISGRLLRSLLIIEYMKQPRLPISVTLNTEDANGSTITFNG